MRIYNNISNLVGNTPIVRLNNIASHLGCDILVKVEYMNPSGSVKDRAVYNMIRDAEKKGLIKPGDTIVEATSGNTGIALATIAAAKRYKLILVIPDTMSADKINRIRALGAQVILTPGVFGMKRAYKEAEKIVENSKNIYMPNQMTNLANSESHYLTTAKEIWEDTEGNIDIFVAGIGTGGTITGTAKKLKELKEDIIIIGVEPAGSPIITEGKRGPHKIQGVGAGFIPDILELSYIDEVITITDDEAMNTARDLARNEGIFVGISSGASVMAAIKYSEANNLTDKIIVSLLPDSGERYLNTELFNADYKDVFVS